MRDYEILKIQLKVITESIRSYTADPSIKVVYEELSDGLFLDNLTYEKLKYCVDEISEWYTNNMSRIKSNSYVRNPQNHVKNLEKINMLKTEIEEYKDEYMYYFKSPLIKQKNPTIDPKNIFIVHGHDDGLKNEVARFIEQLGLKPIILHEQVSSGDTIIEKIERYSNVGFGIVLYTPCDIGALKDHENNLQQRARQNVVFEHGYLIGKIGRSNVVALVKDEVEKPNDVSGVVYTNYKQDGAWKTDIGKELKVAGYDVDFNKLF